MLKEINQRESDGVTVTFFWNDSAKNNPSVPEFKIVVIDAKCEENFTLDADTFEDAKECYYHPFASASRVLKTGKVSA